MAALAFNGKVMQTFTVCPQNKIGHQNGSTISKENNCVSYIHIYLISRPQRVYPCSVATSDLANGSICKQQLTKSQLN